MVSSGQVLVSSGADATKAIASFSQMEQQSGQIYKIMLQPCLPRFAADETVNRVLSQIGNHNADMAAQMMGRVELLRQADSDKAVFSEQGIALFTEKGYVEDLPDLLYEAITREERTGILRWALGLLFQPRMPDAAVEWLANIRECDGGDMPRHRCCICTDR